MADLPANLMYTEEHEYLSPTEEDDVFTVGITDYAQGELGDIVFVELPAAGETFEAGASFGTVEAVKAVSELYMPVNGEVVESNSALSDDPSLVNSDPYGAGWMIRIRVRSTADVEGLLSPEDYADHIG